MNIEKENIREINTEFRLTDKITNLVKSCGINPDEIDPKLLGRGGNHKVYRFKSGERVIKIPINPHIGTVSSALEERENITLYLQYFPDFSVPTSFFESPLGYCVVMKYVDGKLVTRADISEANTIGREKPTAVKEQLGEIIQHNQRLMDEQGKMMDLVGLEGLVSALRGLQPNGRPAQLTNVRIEKNGKLRIVDYDLISLRNFQRPLSMAQAVFAFQLNQQVLSYHFGINYRRRDRI